MAKKIRNDSLCFMTSKNGSQCKNKPLWGSRFCRTHFIEAQGGWLFKFFWLALSLILSIPISIFFSQQTDQSIAHSVDFPQNIELPLLKSDTHVGFGSFSVSLDTNIKEPFAPFSFVPIKLSHDENNRLLVWITAQDAEGRTAAIVEKSKLVATYSLGYDVNTNSEVFEVIGPDQLPVIQLISVNNGNLLALFMYAYKDGALLIIDGTGLTKYPINEKVTNPLIPIFKYPSYLYRGQFSENFLNGDKLLTIYEGDRLLERVKEFAEPNKNNLKIPRKIQELLQAEKIQNLKIEIEFFFSANKLIILRTEKDKDFVIKILHENGIDSLKTGQKIENLIKVYEKIKKD